MIDKNLMKVYSNTKEEVILEFDEKTISSPLTIATHPYLTSNMRYINIQKGNDTWAFIIVHVDGSTKKFFSGTALNLMEAKLVSEVKSFLYKHQIFTKLNLSEEDALPKCEILFNPNYYKWQIRLSANQQCENIFLYAKDEGECLIKASEMFNCNARFFQKVLGAIPVHGVVLEKIEI